MKKKSYHRPHSTSVPERPATLRRKGIAVGQSLAATALPLTQLTIPALSTWAERRTKTA